MTVTELPRLELLDAARIAIGDKAYVRTADILFAFYPDRTSSWRGQIGSLYRNLHPGVSHLVRKGEAGQFGYYVPEDKVEAFATFITSHANHEHALRRGQAIGVCIKLKRTQEALDEQRTLVAQVLSEKSRAPGARQKTGRRHRNDPGTVAGAQQPVGQRKAVLPG